MDKIQKFVLVSLVIVGSMIIWNNSKSKSINLPYPYIYASQGSNARYYCEALLGTFIHSPSKNLGLIKKGIHAEVFKATDKISIKIEGNKMLFLTYASFEAGDTANENPYNIIYNDAHKILAIDQIESNLIVSIFTLNKDTGIANWSKIKPNGLFTGNPDSQSYCLKCEPR